MLKNPNSAKYFKGDCHADAVPLAKFKSDHLKIFEGKQIFKTFLSSGTTQSDRSRAHYSDEGLSAYKAASVAHFKGVLTKVFSPNIHTVHGFSLIPNMTGNWQQSSLAQMVSWISESLPVTFVDEAQPLDLANQKNAVWIFGTALHFLNYADTQPPIQLPKGSMIIETGGFKGQHKTTTRSDLYKKICTTFDISTNQIISEYGMCELAAQAYDYVPQACHEIIPLAERWFQFAPDVNCGVSISEGSFGCLVVSDRNRIDIPKPIITEDLVHLLTDGRFQLIGRALNSPTKGCSLNVNDIQMPTKPPSNTKQKMAIKLGSDALSLENRIKLLIDGLKTWIGGKKARTLWTTEFTSPVVARNTVEDLLCQIPCDEDEWLQVVRKTEKYLNQGETWIFLLPSSHSVASLYPLSVAYLMGIKSIIKCSRRNPGAENVILEFVSYMNQALGADISALDPTLGLKQTIEVEAAKGIFCFGADQTIHWLKSHLRVPIVGAGHGLSVCIVTHGELEREMAKITKDIRALGGRGCMSTRSIILLASEQETEERVTATIRAFNEHLANTAGSETTGYRTQIFDKEFLTEDEVRQLLLECSADIIPTIVVRHCTSKKNHHQLQTMIRSIPEIQWITTNEVNLGTALTHLPLGESQTPKWDGRHGSTPLFQRL